MSSSSQVLPSSLPTNDTAEQRLLETLHSQQHEVLEPLVVGEAALDPSQLPDLLAKLAEAARIQIEASGVVVALRRNGLVTCLAKSGEIGPELGSRLDANSGLSGACLRTGAPQLCNETLLDARVDGDVCRRLGLRSIVAVPLRVENNEVVGIVEAFAVRPQAFTGEDMEFLTRVAAVIENSEKKPVRREETQSKPMALDGLRAKIADAKPPRTAQVARPSRLRVAIPVAVVVVILAISVTAWVVWRSKQSTAVTEAAALPVRDITAPNPATTAIPPQNAKPSPSLSSPSESPLAIRDPASNTSRGIVPAAKTTNEKDSSEADQASAAGPNAAAADNSQTLEIKPLARKAASDPVDVQPPPIMIASASTPLGDVVSTSVQQPALASRISQGIVPGRVEHKVAPIYPLEAIHLGISGEVVLTATISETGEVEKVQVIKGQPILAKAAVDAVKQWRYHPFTLNGTPVKVDTQITADFKGP
jgi:TonB family protein